MSSPRLRCPAKGLGGSLLRLAMEILVTNFSIDQSCGIYMSLKINVCRGQTFVNWHPVIFLGFYSSFLYGFSV